MRSYNVRTTALTIGAPVKWVDNILSLYSVRGVIQGTQGVERSINDDALLVLALCRVFTSELGVPRANAVALANRVVAERLDSFEIGPGVSITFAMADIERQLHARLSDATEAVAHIRRGRPPRIRPVS